MLPNLGSLKVRLPLHDIFSHFEKITMRKISNCSSVTSKYSSNLDLIFTESLMLLFTKGTCFAKYIKQLCSIKSFSKKIKRIQSICMKTDNLISMLKRLNSLSCLQCLWQNVYWAQGWNFKTIVVSVIDKWCDKFFLNKQIKLYFNKTFIQQSELITQRQKLPPSSSDSITWKWKFSPLNLCQNLSPITHSTPKIVS